MVAVGEFESLTLAPSLADLDARQGASDVSLTPEYGPSNEAGGERRPLAHWQAITKNMQIAHIPASVRQIVDRSVRKTNGAEIAAVEDDGDAESKSRFRDWVFVGQSLADWSFRSQMYFMPTSQWGARARQRPFVADTGPSTAVVFDWDIGALEAQFLGKLGITMYSCDLDELFGQEVGQ
jgi:hypothetical protein